MRLSLGTPADMGRALCRAGLHLQLTTELVTAAAAAGAGCAEAQSMWQRSGALAVVGATAWALELLAALSGCGLEKPSGEATLHAHIRTTSALCREALFEKHAGCMGLYMHLMACLHVLLRLKVVKG